MFCAVQDHCPSSVLGPTVGPKMDIMMLEHPAVLPNLASLEAGEFRSAGGACGGPF